MCNNSRGVILLAIVGACLSFANCQEYMVFNQQDFDVWEPDNSESYTLQANQALLNLCENYLITLGDDVLDCARIRLTPKSLPYEDSHEIRKRDVEEPELERSGTENPVEEVFIRAAEVPSNATEDEPTKEAADGHSEKLTEEKKEANATKEEEQATGEKPQDNQEAKEEKEEDTGGDNVALTKTDEETPAKADVNPEGNSTATEQQTSDAAGATVTEEKPAPKTGNQTATAEEEQKTSDVAAKLTEEEPATKTDNEASTPTDDNRQAVTEEAAEGKPGDNAATETEVKPSETNEKVDEAEKIPKEEGEREEVKEDQSGVAVLLKAPDAGKEPSPETVVVVELADSEKSLAKMAANAKQSLSERETTEHPEIGESSPEVVVSRAGKDTTILVVLFAAVLVVGGAAFAYNYAQKRKQRAPANRKPTGANGATHDVDPEAGSELKPLVKGSGAAGEGGEVKVYSDAKSEVKA